LLNAEEVATNVSTAESGADAAVYEPIQTLTASGCSETHHTLAAYRSLTITMIWSWTRDEELRGTCHVCGGFWQHRWPVHQNSSHWKCVRWQITGNI